MENFIIDYFKMSPTPRRKSGHWDPAAYEIEKLEKAARAEALRRSRLPGEAKVHMREGRPLNLPEQTPGPGEQDGTIAGFNGRRHCRACRRVVGASGECTFPHCPRTRARPDLDRAAAEAAAQPRRIRGGLDPEHGMVVALKRNGAEILGKLRDWSPT